MSTPATLAVFPQRLTVSLSIEVEVSDATEFSQWVDSTGALNPTAVADIWDMLGEVESITRLNGYTSHQLQQVLTTAAGI